MLRRVSHAIAHLGFAVCLAAFAAVADGYRLPPQEVVDIVTAPPTPWVEFSPDHRFMAVVERDAMPSIADLSRRMLRLAGMRVDPVVNARFRTSYNSDFELRRMGSGEVVYRSDLGEGEGLASLDWSPRGSALAYTVAGPDGMRLVTVRLDGEKIVARRHAGRLATVIDGMSWLPDGRSLLVPMVPKDRGPEPPAPTVPRGPNIQESFGNTSPTRTYQDLLQDPHDEALFEHYATSQLTHVSLDGGSKSIGEPAIRSVSVAPDGRHLLVSAIVRPFSYLQGYWTFPRRIEVWNLDGKVLYTVAVLPQEENVPIGGVPTGRRSVRWMGNAPATLMWAEALDGGDPEKEAEHRDRLFAHEAPFTADPEPLLDVEQRYSGAGFFADRTRMSVSEYDRDRRWTRTLLHDLENGGEPKVLVDRSVRDRYGDPGSMLMTYDDRGVLVPLQHGDWVFRRGRGASPEGDRPFLDRQNLETLETERLWRCETGTYESVVEVLGFGAGPGPKESKGRQQSDGKTEREGRGKTERQGERGKPKVITSRETPTEPLNFYVVDLQEGSREALTDFRDPTPQIRGIQKRLVRYEREDGTALSATLYLPADYEEGTRLPLIVWAYPREFNDARTAGQVSASPSRFTRIVGSSHLTLVTQGYAIMDGATMPVIGDPETMNDTFIEQIVSSAKAAIDYAVEAGVADRDRVGVGGHSYGAFMTANLLAHSDLFKAGLARSGAYNRTLTPFGFQSERRPLWKARDVYFEISPFMHANTIDEPLLLIHGEEDNNSGTFPMQSRRMYQAIKGNGGTVRLVMLPKESHGYRAEESVLHVQAEMIDWFDRFLKGEP